MKIVGSIKQLFPVQSGTSKTTGNAWQKRDFIVEYIHGEYPKEILLSTMDTNIIGKLAVGQEVEVTFDFTVRTWTNPQGVTKYFNEPRIWQNGLHCIGQGQASLPAQQAAPQPQAQTPAPQQPASGSSGDLPFD